MSEATEIKFPATVMVHWPSGPVPACHEHAAQLHALGKFMGGHVVSTTLTEPAECANCINENESRSNTELSRTA